MEIVEETKVIERRRKDLGLGGRSLGESLSDQSSSDIHQHGQRFQSEKSGKWASPSPWRLSSRFRTLASSFVYSSCDPNSAYDVSTGIKCSGWREYSTRFPQVTRKQVLDHMNAREEPSPFISMTDSPARLVNFGANRWHLTRVATINATKMERIGIRYSRTTQMAEKFGLGSKSNAEPDGAKYLNSAHWLAQFWIPAECIERVMEWGDFMRVCRRESIVSGLQSR